MTRLLISLIFILSAFNGFSQWWDTDYAYRVEITADADSVLVTETGTYLYYYPLSEMPASFWTNAQTDGDDVRVTDASHSQVPAYVIDYDDPNETGALWFTGDSDAATDESFFVYYGNGSATAPTTGSTYGRDSVFRDMQAGWSLHEGRPASVSYPNLSALNTSVLDLSSPTTDAGDGVTGKLESQALNHDQGSSDREDGPNNNDWKPTVPVTFLAWYNPSGTWADGSKNQECFVSKYTSIATGYRVFIWSVRAPLDSVMRLQVYDASATLSLYDSDSGVPTPSGWAMFATTVDGSGNGQHYYNGASFGSGATGLPTTWETSPTNTSWNSVVVGGAERSSTSPDFMADGDLQYVFIANSAWSANKIKTYYRNTNTPSTFWSTGTEENQGGGAARRLFNIN